MAEGDVDHAATGKVVEVGQVILQGQAVLNAEHDALATRPFVGPEVGGSAGKGEVIAIGSYNLLNTVEDAVGVSLWRGSKVVGHYFPFTVLVVPACLWQVGHHDGGVEPSLGHLMQVNEQTVVTGGEVDALGEEHGGVAMGIEGEHTAVQVFHLSECLCLTDEPLEERQTVVAHALGMPLYADDGLVLRALHSLNDAIGGGGGDFQVGAGRGHGLVVEGVDEETVAAEDVP